MPVTIAFIGAGSTVFMKNIVGDALLTPALSDARLRLMDVDDARLEESAIVARKLIESTGPVPRWRPPPISAAPWTARISWWCRSRSAATAPAP